VHYSLSPVRKCNNVRDLYELPDFWPPNIIHYIKKSGAASLPEKVQDVTDLRRHVIDVWLGVKRSVIDDGIDQWRKTSPCLHSSRKRTF